MKIEQVLSRFERFRKSGDGWSARCPAHEDAKNPLSITKRDGKILLHCHAGCATELILARVGLQLRDLYVNSVKSSGQRIVATYDYTDEEGKPLYQVVRFEPKDFRARRPDGAGGWIWNLKGVRRVPYRLPELLASGDDYVKETTMVKRY